MAKIDTNLIEGYADMTPEQKLAALEGFEYEDNAVELERQKNALSKANSEAAEWKRKHNALLTDEQRKQQEQAEKWENMEKELAGLRKEKTVAGYKAKLVAQGYDETLADATAAAMESGDMATVFANNQKFLEGYAKKIIAEKLKGTPRGADGNPGDPEETEIMPPLPTTLACRQKRKLPQKISKKRRSIKQWQSQQALAF